MEFLIKLISTILSIFALPLLLFGLLWYAFNDPSVKTSSEKVITKEINTTHNVSQDALLTRDNYDVVCTYTVIYDNDNSDMNEDESRSIIKGMLKSHFQKYLWLSDNNHEYDSYLITNNYSRISRNIKREFNDEYESKGWRMRKFVIENVEYDDAGFLKY